MLKPNRKILRKEIKKDPFLETFEKIENGFAKNRKTISNVLFFFVAIIIGGLVFINNQNQSELESSSAFGTALVAYSNLDYENAKFQFESISSSYEGTESETLSNYFLGKIAYELGDYNEAKLLLNVFLENAKNAKLVCGAIKLLVHISFQEGNYANSFKILEKSELLNKKIRDSNLPEDIRIGAIIRKDKVIIPRSNFIFEKDDLIVFLAKREELKAVENIFSLGSI